MSRFQFTERVAELLHSSAPDALIGLCFLDLDALTLPQGQPYPVGGQLLTAVVQRLDDGLTKLDGGLTKPGSLLASLGGARLAVLVSGPGLMPGAAAEVAGQVVQLLAAPFPVGGYEVSVSADIGVVERTVAETSHTDLLSCAVALRARRAKAGAAGDRTRWMAVDLDRARAMVRMG